MFCLCRPVSRRKDGSEPTVLASVPALSFSSAEPRSQRIYCFGPTFWVMNLLPSHNGERGFGKFQEDGSIH